MSQPHTPKSHGESECDIKKHRVARHSNPTDTPKTIHLSKSVSLYACVFAALCSLPLLAMTCHVSAGRKPNPGAQKVCKKYQKVLEEVSRVLQTSGLATVFYSFPARIPS